MYILKTYGAGEKIIKNASSKVLTKRIQQKNKNVNYLENDEILNKLLIDHSQFKSIIKWQKEN